MAMGIGGWFVDQPDQRLGEMIMRETTLKFVLNPRAEPYTRPLAVLVDGLSASTSEILAGGLKDLGRARIFGQPTAGAALPSIIDTLPNGDRLQYAFANYISVGGRPLEGDGVQPDVEVKPDRAALLAGRDAVIDAAVNWILAQELNLAQDGVHRD
jgi:carboxyl-terminal processing protease